MLSRSLELDFANAHKIFLGLFTDKIFAFCTFLTDTRSDDSSIFVYKANHVVYHIECTIFGLNTLSKNFKCSSTVFLSKEGHRW